MAAVELSPSLRRSAAALAAAVCCAGHAQQPSSTVVITGRSASGASVAGFGDTPLTRMPLQANVFDSTQLKDADVSSMAGLTKLDASVSDAYNAEGYWSSLAVRGYSLDNRFNYRRDGLPINAETAIALDNKERLELFRGTSGIQAGTSAPGGLVNLVVKRPQGSQRSLTLGFKEHGSLLAAVDLGESFGKVGLRLNAAIEKLDPPYRNTRGRRSMLALAADFRLAAGTLLQAEVETSRQRQPSLAGFSMLGNHVPAGSDIDPRVNLNDQPWRQPVVFDGTTASLRLQQRLSDNWNFVAHAMQQRLKTDDGTAFPFGVYDPATYECAQWCDRYAPDGTFTYWEYLSNNERRTNSALQLSVDGQLQTAAVQHRVEAGMLLSRQRGRFEDQVFDIAGTGRIDGGLVTPPSAGFTDANTNRDDRSTEVFVRDAMNFGGAWQVWAGLRHTRLEREAQRTSPAADGLRPTAYSRTASTPWLAVAYRLAPRTMLYASWGKGLETDVAPNRDRYTNAGQSLELESRQFEMGFKHGSDRVEAALTVFDIDRGQTADIGLCGASMSCTRVADGSARHRGVEAQGSLNLAQWRFNAGAMLLDAQRRGSAQAGINGQRPVNVPARTLRLNADYSVAAMPGLVLQAGLVAESDRVVLPYDQSARIPGWSRVDLGARWRQGVGSSTLVWRVGLDNATDRRAWKEAPYQFGHVYLYPLAPRTWRASLQASF